MYGIANSFWKGETVSSVANIDSAVTNKHVEILFSNRKFLLPVHISEKIMGKMRCHYEVLGVSRDADQDELKKSYRKMALKVRHINYQI